MKMEKSHSAQKTMKSQRKNPSRAARLYWQQTQESQPLLISSPRLEHEYQFNPAPGLENPLVIASIIAGVIGVLIIAVIILGVWIRSRLISFDNRKTRSRTSSMSRRSANEHIHANSTIMSSISTLDDDNSPIDSCQFDSFRLDDTTINIIDEEDNSEVHLQSVVKDEAKEAVCSRNTSLNSVDENMQIPTIIISSLPEPEICISTLETVKFNFTSCETKQLPLETV